MSPQDRELMQQALKALDDFMAPKRWPFAIKEDCRDVMKALRARLAEPDDEPVARALIDKRFHGITGDSHE